MNYFYKVALLFFWCQDELLLKHFAVSTNVKARRRSDVADVIIKTDIV